MRRKHAVRTALAALALACLLWAPAAHAAEAYTLDPVHSSVVFRIQHMGIAWFYGRFNMVVGEFTLDRENPAKSSVSATVPVESVDTHNGKRDEHLRSADFFHMLKFPEMTFQSTRVEQTGPDEYRVEGEFTLLGVTKPLAFTARHTGSGPGPEKKHREGFETEFTLNRSDFGMDYGLGGLLGGEVGVILSFEGVQN